MLRSTNGKGRHVSYNADGELCMTVVDPVTRKLLIPKQYIFDTRARQRGTLPSLCQLYLSGRCRQGQGCYQVHADWMAVQRLRAQVDSLPCCCPGHGDKDHLGLMENAPLRDFLNNSSGHHHGTSAKIDPTATAATESNVCASDVVVYVPGCSTYEGNYVPLHRVSYTTGLRRLLEEQHVLKAPPNAHVSLLNSETGFPEDKIVVDATGSTVCRLHAMDRCRYAEECKFLHLCKELTKADPQLTASPPATAGEHTLDSSFNASVTSASMSVTTTIGASATSLNRRGKNRHSSTTAPRQSVFTSVSMQQQQQSSPSLAGDGNGVGSRPLLVPQREDALHGTPIPFLSKSMSSCRATPNVTATPPCSVVQSTDAFSGLNPPMANSVGSFPGGNNNNSPTAAPSGYASNNGRIRVSLSLPIAKSPPSTINTMGFGMPNSFDKVLTSSDGTLSAVGNGCADVGCANSLGNCDLTHSMLQGCSSSSSVRWHHNPYGPFLSKCEGPNGGSCGSYTCMHHRPSPSSLFTAVMR
ncbi:hypothetical protein ABL78_3131 [Leptomonas seymouri]|uniref:C3H1-type domain-containing protein n=1 Tax=Leptomonas seymouri TaxID=5684 RepID=A0A0N1I6L3_LEPSE|nr:hypothetical protein ABL78_3131 [Leptomonas seymouri]|eukprot:KPI87773.1 hypothetical protein ABL78_3131 [Leptomonas seymouri]